MLLPPEGAAGLIDGLGALARSRLPGGATLDATCRPISTADTAPCWRAWGGTLPSRVATSQPGRRSSWNSTFIASREVDISDPFRTVERIARARHVPVQRAATYRGAGVLGELVGLSEGESEAALADAIAGVDFGMDHVAAAGRAWAIGDLKTVRANISEGETPLANFLHTSAGRQTYDPAVNDTTDVPRSALAKPGVTVAVLRLAALVQQGGALDRLRAEGGGDRAAALSARPVHCTSEPSRSSRGLPRQGAMRSWRPTAAARAACA